MDSKKLVAAILLVAVIGFAGMKLMTSKPASEATVTNQQTQEGATTVTTSPTESAMITQEVTPMTTKDSYKNGTYSAVGNYQSPAGKEEISLKLTLKDGTITDSTFEGKGVNPTTKKMQGLFAAGYKTLVVGKSIDDLKLDVVNGSSLTPKGFEDALQKIKTQASAS